MYLRNERLSECYRKGLEDEQRVMEFLRSQGYEVLESSLDDDYKLDIDCYVNGKPVSIKSQHKGVNYQNIGFELVNQLTKKADCKVTQDLLGQHRELTLKDLDDLVTQGSWEPAWFYKGKASNYLFYQGDSLRLYTKKSIEAYVNTKGFLRVRPLKADTKSYLGGRYRHCNTICGYLKWSDVPHRIWMVS